MKALAITSAKPSALLPGLPTVSASGLPEYEAVSILGVFAPAKTPGAIVRRLNREIVQALNATEVKERLFAVGQETVGSSPEAFAAAVKSEMARLGALIKRARLRDE
jgi:tripartite-type tricarboxylate transporter receptor subunit TctC